MANVVQYIKFVAIGADQFATTLLGGFPDETLSSYAYRLEQQKKLGGIIFRPYIDWLTYEGHCRDACQSERDRLQMPPELR